MTTTLLRPVLTISGLALIVTAAMLVMVPLGLAAAGVSCLLVEWLVTE